MMINTIYSIYYEGENMNLALTGHRPQRLGFNDDEKSADYKSIKLWIKSNIEREILEHRKPVTVYCGMADGCDVAFGLVACKLKENNRPVKLICVLPCKNYNSSHKYYSYLKEHADEWVELSAEFYRGCDNVRDQYMVDHCDKLLAVWDGNKSGGVWSTIKKAKKAGKEIEYYKVNTP